jgi:hypothetical protein
MANRVELFSIPLTDCTWEEKVDGGFKKCVGVHKPSQAKSEAVVTTSIWLGYLEAFKKLTETVEFIEWIKKEAVRVKKVLAQKTRKKYSEYDEFILDPNGSILEAYTFEYAKKKSKKKSNQNKAKKKSNQNKAKKKSNQNKAKKKSNQNKAKKKSNQNKAKKKSNQNKAKKNETNK